VRARDLRKSSPDAERALWQRLRNRALAGYKFRRQHPIGSYFADFACEVLRFTDREALTERDGVMARILDWLTTHHPHPSPLPQAGEGVQTSKD
jgi:very-short-patch-repair endonuclease